MQIFMPYADLTKSAQYLDARRRNKQILELAQITSSALWHKDEATAKMLHARGHCYKPAYMNHPVVLWAKDRDANIKQCFHYCDALNSIYYEATGKCHKSAIICGIVFSYFPVDTLSFLGWQNFTTNHKHITDVYEAYRLELQLKWAKEAKR